MSDLRDILDDIGMERHRQDQKFGGPAHDDAKNMLDWSVILDAQLRASMGPEPERQDLDQFRRYMIRLAAVAVAAVEWTNRRVDEQRCAEGQGGQVCVKCQHYREKHGPYNLAYCTKYEISLAKPKRPREKECFYYEESPSRSGVIAKPDQHAGAFGGVRVSRGG